ncbi:hypothetical protein [Enterobacter mori]|uniref:hypothetical protein n=1 Tax=Enterobacter mori TaxID=539813 RepID=UPI002DBE0586|nr:hypothetical protein [Enterobacter mori]MEB7916233.1 hypothetical protein [Enterobacter mori]HDR2706070.1 hypothetical protein [Enterobacter mori]HDR2710487.1 hypothetical protein [Enterobacter mori]
MKIQLIVVSLILMFSLNRVVAQENSTAENLGKAIPPNVLNALKNATDVKKIFPVNPGERFDGQVLKADEIIFAPGATLTLTNTSAPFIVISAKRWKFADAEVTTKIMIAAAQASDGEDGDNGQDGKNGEGEINRRGNDGKPGLPGEPGKNGETSSQPHIYLVAGELTSPNGEPLPGSLRLAVVASGIDGGNGGTGGKGGNGGRGAPGKKGATSAVDCSSGPGKGGTGGSAGQGGKGGLGGDGANGSDITVVGTRSVNELFSYARIFNDGGFGGRPGRSGLPGKIGLGGIQAGPNGWCKSGQPGDAGDYPEPLDLGDGEAGKDGTKGDVTLVTVKNLSPVF